MSDDFKVVAGGLLSSSFHALTGPDHLAALLPFIFCKKWYVASMYGIVWGAGHGLSSSCMGIVAVGLKGSLLADSLIAYLTLWTNFLIGMTLIVIGVMGLHELNSDDDTKTTPDNDNHTNNDSAAEYSDLADDEFISLTTEAKTAASRINGTFFIATLSAQFANGFLLGLALDAIPSVSPAFWLDSYSSWLEFFVSYIIGTLVTMGALAAIVGESTKFLGRFVVHLPQRLAYVSSYGSICIGVCWTLYHAQPQREVLLVFVAISPCLLVGTAYLAFISAQETPLYLLIGTYFPQIAIFLRAGKKVKVDTPAHYV